MQVSAFSFTSASSSVASGRIAYTFGLKGASASIDTACSASLVAVHMAATDIAGGAAQAAVAAGVLLCLVPESTLMVHKAGMLAADGRCKVLDASADGYVLGWMQHANSSVVIPSSFIAIPFVLLHLQC